MSRDASGKFIKEDWLGAQLRARMGRVGGRLGVPAAAPEPEPDPAQEAADAAQAAVLSGGFGGGTPPVGQPPAGENFGDIVRRQIQGG